MSPPAIRSPRCASRWNAHLPGLRVCLTSRYTPVTTMRFVALLVMLMMRQSSGNAGLFPKARKQGARTGAGGPEAGERRPSTSFQQRRFLRTDASQSLTKTETPSVCARLPIGCAVGYHVQFDADLTLDSKMFAASGSSSPATLGVTKSPLWQPPRSWGLSLAALPETWTTRVSSSSVSTGRRIIA